MFTNKYLILLSVVMLQACIGGTYAWSIYDAEFIRNYDVDPRLATLPFNLFYVVFPATLLFSHSVIAKLGSRTAAQLGILLFSIGWGIASLGESHYLFTIIGVGLIGGVGVGLAYLVPIKVGISWFPDNGGLVTGLAVGGFAVGAAAIGELSEVLIHAMKINPFLALAITGSLYFMAGIFPACCMNLKESEPILKAHPNKLNWKLACQDVVFRRLFLAMTAGLATGFFINSKIVMIAGEGYQSLISLVSVFAISNALGRVIWGYFSDRFRVSSCMRVNLGLQAITVLVLLQISFLNYVPTLLAAVAGFQYGGVLVLYATGVRKIWGDAAFTQVYAWLFMSNIVAALINTILSSSLSNVSLSQLSFILFFLVFSGVVSLFKRLSSNKYTTQYYW
ncbi:MFS transporter [Vibrio sp. JC009]|uniref:MFS transporter n=1 Tax=Vibrio sp. JC009 TaxID=2912314 RepID=UPI0023B1CE3F|nr:MFS transporter [Vibrio sp. JC009]WED24943.1 MFS transporter [Vibrio sp. JC009]